MKYCVNYLKGYQPHFKLADEIRVKLNNKNMKAVEDFIKERKNQRILVKVDDAKGFIESGNVEIVKSFSYDNFTIELGSYRDAEMLDLGRHLGSVPHFYNDYVNNFDMLWDLISLKPTDMFIVEELGFDIKNVKKILSEHNINVRCLANVAQSSGKYTPPLKKFFIRPEDVDTYESYIDVIEFFKGRNVNNEGTYLKIYSEDKKWAGPLKEIIFSLNSDIDNRTILPHPFIERRLSCGKKCLKGKNCNICSSVEKLAETLKENNYAIIKN